jgi:LPXTG-site transpeptidase (sortase) family protein
VRLVIPGIDLDRELFSVGLDENRVPIVLPHDIGWYNLSAQPGQGENIVLWGHVLRFKAQPKVPAPFARLKELSIGAPLTLYGADGSAHDYVVVDQVLVTPSEVKYILPQGRELVTLVSCIGDKVVVNREVEMTHRLITIAAPAD